MQPVVYLDSGRERIVFMFLGGAGIALALVMQFIPPAFAVIGVPVAILALLLSILSFGMKDYSYLVEPLMRMKGRTLVLDANEPFYLASNGKSIVIRQGSLIYATSFIKIPIYTSSTEMSDDERFNFATAFSKAISISSVPMRLSSQLHLINKDEYLKVITDRLNEVEDRYNSILADKSAPKTSIDRVKGEVNMWHNLLDSVSKANSQSQVAFVTVTSLGGTEDEAVNIASTNAEQLSAGLSTALGIPTSVVNGAEMLLFIEPEFLIPASTAAESMSNDKK